MASASVTVGRRPSGTLATRIPTAKRKFAQNPRPMRVPAAKKTIPVTAAMAATVRVARRISVCNGVGPGSTAPARCAIFPNSVAIPVAKATAVPEPKTMCVPAKTTLGLSRNSPSQGPGLRGRASDSPVRAALSTMSVLAATTRASAGTLSPSARRNRSPGTISRAGSRSGCLPARPSRGTASGPEAPPSRVPHGIPGGT